MLEIINMFEEYEDYDEALCHNGGSYYQPTWTITFSDGAVMEIEDSSCGDFGSRIDGSLKIPGKEVLRFNYGSMNGMSQAYTDLSESEHRDYIRLVRQYTIYDILTKEDVQEYYDWEYGDD